MRRESQEGGDRCTHIADSHCYTAGTNTILQNNYTPIKNKEPCILTDTATIPVHSFKKHILNLYCVL